MRALTRVLILLLLTAALSAQQIQIPPVRFAGPTGPNGPFPFFNSGTITLASDADYTLVYPDISASVIRITTATGVTLSAARNIIGPTAAAPYFGFEFTIENATAGGQSLVITNAAGTPGVTIPNGSAAMVIYDGTRYVQVGSTAGAAGPITSPLVVPSADGVNNLTITVPNSGGGNPSLTSSTGTINIASLFVSNLAGAGVSCLQTDALGNVTRTGVACGSAAGGSGTVTSVGLTAPSFLTVTGSPITTSGTLTLTAAPQTTGSVLAGPSPLNETIPAIVQSNICPVASGLTLTCTFPTPTTAGNLIYVGASRYAVTVTDNLGQTYSADPNNGGVQQLTALSYKENTAAGVTSVTATQTQGSGGVIVLLEISGIALSNSFDTSLWNLGNISGVNTPITFGQITTTNPIDMVVGYWACSIPSSTTPTQSGAFTLGGYQSLPSSWSGGFVWRVTTSIGPALPAVGTANCPGLQQQTWTNAFKAGVSLVNATPSFRPLVTLDLPKRPWSDLTDPTPNAFTQLDMNTGATYWYTNLTGTNSFNDWATGLYLIDNSTSNRDMGGSCGSGCGIMLGTSSAFPGNDPFNAIACGSTNNIPNFCGGMIVSGVTGNIVMQANSGVMIPGTTGLVSNGGITSDTSVSAPQFFTCTAANPCQVPSPQIAAKFDPATKRMIPAKQPAESPTTRLSGGEPLASVHLHDFSTTPPSNGQVPIYNASLGKYVPGTVSGGPGGGGANPPYTLKALSASYNITGADFASCTTLTYSLAAPITIYLPSVVPPAGECVKVINYGGTSALIINHSGILVNGNSFASSSLPAATSNLSPNGMIFISNGTDYNSERYQMSVPFQGLQTGVLINGTLTLGNLSKLTFGGTGIVDANQINGGTVPVSAPSLATDPTGKIIAGSAGGSPAWSSVTAGSNTAVLLMSGSGIIQPAPASGFVIANFLGAAAGDSGGINGNVTEKIPPFANGCLQHTASGLVWGACGAAPAPVYSTSSTGTLTTTTGILAGYPVTMVTPAVDSTYRLEFQVKQNNTSAGCTTAGTIGIRVGYTDADVGFVATTAAGAVGAMSVQTGNVTNLMALGTAPAATVAWSGIPFVFTARAGTAVTLAVNQQTASAGCTTFPTFLLKPILYAVPY